MRFVVFFIAAAIVAVAALYALQEHVPSATGGAAEPSAGPTAAESSIPAPTAALARARSDPGQRQAYLDRILAGLTLPHCSGVVYDHDGSAILAHIKVSYEQAMAGISYAVDFAPWERQFAGGQYDIYTPVITDGNELGKKFTIFVGRWTFEQYAYMTDVEFRHVLGVHEARHCEQYSSGLGYFDRFRLQTAVRTGEIQQDVAYEVAEMDANYHGLSRIASGEFLVNADYRRRVREAYRANQMRLRSVLPTSSSTQRELIERALGAAADIEPTL